MAAAAGLRTDDDLLANGVTVVEQHSFDADLERRARFCADTAGEKHAH
jgi:hypothetical protein